nr:MAG TPA: hypothetical protein [Caudoviricetes sp.]
MIGRCESFFLLRLFLILPNESVFKEGFGSICYFFHIY